MCKGIGLLLAALALLVAVSAPASAQGAFADVPTNHWAYNAIQTLAEQGLVEGYPDGFFHGQRPMTRYEFAQAIARLSVKIEERITAAGGVQGKQGEQGIPGPPGGITPEQQELLNRLEKEFAPELKALRTDLDALTERVAALEETEVALPKITVSGDSSVRFGLYGDELNIGSEEVTGYPYPWFVGGWFDPDLPFGAINFRDPEGELRGFSIPISDALKDAYKANDFFTQRTRLHFTGDLTDDLSVHTTILADPRSNQTSALYDTLYGFSEDTIDNTLGFRSPNDFYSDGIMDTVRVDEAWMKLRSNWLVPWELTAGKQYFSFGQGLMVNNSQQATKAGRIDIGLGRSIQVIAVMGALDREAFFSQSASDLSLPPPDATEISGQDNINYFRIAFPLGSWEIGGGLLDTGFRAESGWNADVKGRIFGNLQIAGEFAQLNDFPDGSDVTPTGVSLSSEDTAWIVGAGWDSDNFGLGARYADVDALYAFGPGGFDPVGFLAVANASVVPTTGFGYLNLPLSSLHPLEEFNPHYINWLERPLFVDPTNVVRGWEVSGSWKNALGKDSPISFRYYDGDAFSEEFLGWLFVNGAGPRPEEHRDADRVWSVAFSKKINDNLRANLVYGQRAVENVMSPTTGFGDDDIKVVRGEFAVSF